MMELIGRAAERSRLVRALTSGPEDLLLVVGVRGIGKSRLLESVAAEVGSRVVKFSPSESRWPYSGLSAIAAGLGGWRAGAIDEVLVQARASGIDEFAIADDLTRALRGGADAARVILDGLDDLDPESASVLAFLLTRRQGTGMRVTASATAIERSGPFGGFKQLRLPRLSRLESMRLAAARFGASTDRGVLRIIADQSGGHPGAIVTAKLTARELSGVDPVRTPLRSDMATALDWSDLGAGGPLGADLLRSLSLAPLTPAEALVGGDVTRQDVLDDLLETGVVEGRHLLRIADRQLCASVHASMDAQHRRALHEDAARLTEVVDPRIALWHRTFVSPPVDTGAALATAATSFAADGQVSAALEFAERALGLPSGLQERRELLLPLAEALTVQGEFRLAERYLRKSLGQDSSHSIAVVRAQASLLVQFSLERVIDERGVDSYLVRHATDSPGSCITLLLSLAQLHFARWDAAKAAVAVRRAVELATDTSDLRFRLVAEVLLSGSPEIDPASATSSTDESLRAFSGLATHDALFLLRALILGDRFADARHVASRMLDNPLTLAPMPTESVLSHVLLLELRAGRTEHVPAALDAWRASALPELSTDAVRALLLAHAASVARPAPSPEVDLLIGRARRRSQIERNEVVERHLVVLEGSRALAHGLYGDAVALLKRAAASEDVADPALLRAEPDLIEALWGAGLQEEARARLAAFSVRVARWPGSWSKNALARVKAVCAGDDGGAAFARARSSSVDASTDDLTRLQAARERMLAAAAGGCVGGVGPADAVHGAAASLALDLLDPQELEIANRVQSGLRNREIAGQLFVSQRTVELRLTRIYRKLGIPSRTHLVELMSDQR